VCVCVCVSVCTRALCLRLLPMSVCVCEFVCVCECVHARALPTSPADERDLTWDICSLSGTETRFPLSLGGGENDFGYSNWRVTGQTRDNGVRHSTSATNRAKAFTLDTCP
jgi:hypothetical protein